MDIRGPEEKSDAIGTSSSEIINHAEQSDLFLRQVLPNVRFTSFMGSYVSYLCGMQYHPGQEPPTKNAFYLVRPEESGGLGVYNAFGRFAWVPKNVSEVLINKYGPGAAVVCFTISNPTLKSCQCVYNIFVFPHGR